MIRDEELVDTESPKWPKFSTFRAQTRIGYGSSGGHLLVGLLASSRQFRKPRTLLVVDVTSRLHSKSPIGYQSVSDKWSLANAVRKVEFKLFQLKAKSCFSRHTPAPSVPPTPEPPPPSRPGHPGIAVNRCVIAQRASPDLCLLFAGRSG